ncbi:hypothetical protein F4803DRAFT_557275 [Xylaria telfairii]|nr:hypothetical protein F4803DRAFT_557275 [Xylaria telfairii]
MEASHIPPLAPSTTLPRAEGAKLHALPPHLSRAHPYKVSPLLSRASARISGSRTKARRGPGRPPTARKLWQQSAMKRRLIRLYLYTHESTLNTKEISYLISSIANLEKQPERATLEPSAGINMNSKIRSTQNELQQLLERNYRDLRPRSREDARYRMQKFRQVRYGRVIKNKTPLTSDILESNNPGTSYHQSFPINPRGTPQMPDINGTYPEPFIPDSIPGVSPTIVDINGTYPEPFIPDSILEVSPTIVDINGTYPEPFVLDSIPGVSPTIADVNIYHGSTFSYDLVDSGDLQEHTEVVSREHVRLSWGDLSNPELNNVGLEDECFTKEKGKDLWNQTTLHLAAKWESNELTLLRIWQFLDKYTNPRAVLNIKSIEGQTFMHILARRWCHLGLQPGITLGSFCSKVKSLGYAFDLPDANGRTFFDCFLCGLESLQISPSTSDMINETLRSLIELRCDLDFLQITVMLTESLIPWTLNPLFMPNEFSTVFDRRTALKAISTAPEVFPNLTENQFHLLLKSRRLTPNLIYALTIAENSAADDMNGYDMEGKTCLMVLIEMARPYKSSLQYDGLLDAFLSNGVDLQLVDLEGNTALHYAVRAQSPSIASRLISAGINAGAHNLWGRSAIHLATEDYWLRSRLDQIGTGYARSQRILVRLFDIHGKIKERQKAKEKPQAWEELGVMLRNCDVPQIPNNGHDWMGEPEINELPDNVLGKPRALKRNERLYSIPESDLENNEIPRTPMPISEPEINELSDECRLSELPDNVLGKPRALKRNERLCSIPESDLENNEIPRTLMPSSELFRRGGLRKGRGASQRTRHPQRAADSDDPCRGRQSRFERVLDISEKFHAYVKSIRKEDEKKRAASWYDRNNFYAESIRGGNVY